MKLSGKNINITSPLLLLALAAALLLTAPACIREDLPTCEERRQDFKIKMSIATRAGEGEESAQADDPESVIHTLKVYAFHGDNLAGYHEQTMDGTLSTTSFYMDVTMYNIGMQQLDFYAIANDQAMLDGQGTMSFNNTTLRSQLEARTFTTLVGAESHNFASGGMPLVDKASYLIKMSDSHNPNTIDGKHEDHSLVDGVFAVTDKEGNDNLESIKLNLKRPVGKLKLFAAKAPGLENQTLTITSVRLLKNGTRMENYVVEKDIETLKQQNFDTSPEVSLAVNSNVSIGVFGANNTDGNTNTFKQENRAVEANYFDILTREYHPYENPYGSSPENWDKMAYYEPDGYDESGKKIWKQSDVQPGPNVADYKGNILQINYKFANDKTDKEGLVYLPPIERNHYYGIYCLFNNTGQLIINYSVADWKDEAQWNLDFQYPAYSSLKPYNSDVVTLGPNVYDPPTWSYGSDAETFKVEFTITGPGRQLWKPVMGNSSESFTYKVYRKNDMTTPIATNEYGDYASAEDSNSNPFVIELVPTPTAANDKATAIMAISFVPAWDVTDRSLLMINGHEADNTYWKNNPENAEKEHISKFYNNPEFLLIDYKQ